MLGIQSIEWKFSMKYLAFLVSVVLRVDTNAVSRKFYAACIVFILKPFV